MTTYTIDQIQSAHASAFEAIQRSTVKDLSEPDPTPDKIEQIVRQAGAGWDLGDDGEYTRESELLWCGYGAAAAGRRVGDYLEDDRCVDVHLHPHVAAECLGSTSRLYYPGRWEEEGLPTPDRLATGDIRRGDILVVDTGRGQELGDHVTLARGPVEADGSVRTVEANAHGRLGDGTTGEGVVFRRRHVDEITHLPDGTRAIYRLRLEHFVGSDL